MKMEKLIDSDLQKEPSEVFEIECKLGKGSYGSVYKARHKQNGFTVAAKLVPVDSELSDIVKEISIMQQCRSEYIVQYYGSFYDSKDLWIVMEYCGAGSVSDIMRLLGRTCTEAEIAVIVKGALYGLEYIHQLKKIHRDVKAGNILLTEEGCAKLADFGVAGQLSDTLAKRNTVIGTPYWMAPEVIQEVGYTCSADIWSLGVTVIEMAEGRPPHADVHPMRALFMIPSVPAPGLQGGRWGAGVVGLVAQCLQKAPEARPTASGLLQSCQFVREAPPALGTLVPVIRAAQEARRAGGRDEEDSCGGGSSGDGRGEAGTMVRPGAGRDSSLSGSGSGGDGDGGSLEAQTMLINSGTGTAAEDGDLGGDTLTQEEARRLCSPQRAAGNLVAMAGGGGREAGSVEEVYRHLETKTYRELEALLDRLDGDLRAELEALEVRYTHKRQPLLDAIEEKTARSTVAK